MAERAGVLQRFALWLARVTAVDVGREPDALTSLLRSGTELDKPWADLLQEFQDSRDAWRKNPLARRLVGLVTSYVVGDGIELSAADPHLAQYLEAFWHHEQNRMALRQHEWSDELTRSGELFVTLHMNPADGMSYVRLLPAQRIDRVNCDPQDYERELSYHEAVTLDDPDYPEGRTWLSPDLADAGAPAAGRLRPICLHFAVNRPAGCVRGESDLAPVLPWLRRYSRWLEDRTRLNAAVHAFLWQVKVPGRQVQEKAAAYRTAPDPGSVLVVDRDNEEWAAVAPDLHANDAEKDGRALRWMIVSGGQGIGLADLGEAETSNLATARAMGEQRSRFMRTRQAYFGHVLATVVLAGYNRAVRLGKIGGQPQSAVALKAAYPDISPADNSELGRAASSLATALGKLEATGLTGERWRRLAVRMVLRFAGENIGDDDLSALLAEAKREREQERRAGGPPSQQEGG